MIFEEEVHHDEFRDIVSKEYFRHVLGISRSKVTQPAEEIIVLLLKLKVSALASAQIVNRPS